jgi:uncharacterized membrane protein YcfT
MSRIVIVMVIYLRHKLKFGLKATALLSELEMLIAGPWGAVTLLVVSWIISIFILTRMTLLRRRTAVGIIRRC